jgi:drug/metabolite transporter (DMT)-like permease
LAALLALAASTSWGLCDFIGGVKSRRLPVLLVVTGAHAVGLLAVAAVLLLISLPAPVLNVAAIAALSGLAQAAAIAAYYRGLSTGAMGVVGPIAATAAIVPLAVGLATNERPTSPQVLGMCLAVAGVATAAYQPNLPGVGGKRLAVGVGMALLAALGFGSFFTLIGIASERGALGWIVFVNRVTGVILLAALLTFFARRSRRRGSSPGQPPELESAKVVTRAPPSGHDALAVAAIGLLSVGGTFLFATATTLGLLSVVSVVGALYPVTTVLLATFLLHERIHRLQRAGTAAALLGVALIAGFGS